MKVLLIRVTEFVKVHHSASLAGPKDLLVNQLVLIFALTMISRYLRRLLPLFLLAAVLVACGSEPTPEPMPTPPPTWTPTPMSAQMVNVDATPTPAATMPPTATPEPRPTQPPIEQPTATPAPTDTPQPQVAKVIVIAPQANLRMGPGTTHPKAGVVKQGDTFVVLGKNPDGKWLEIQVNGQPVWIFSNLVRVEHPEVITVSEIIPTPPPAPTQPPPPPTPTPQPAATDPCAGIGGDGCKWHIRGGPAFAPNTFGLKLTFGFVHGGRGDEPQGSYFVWLEKNGVKLPVPDSVRSVTGAMRQGPNGPYNYEYSIGLNDLPDKKIEGCYVGWVLDGNGERDSQNFQFCVPEGQGEVWILFDQN